jgi:signal transduction histidine kinase
MRFPSKWRRPYVLHAARVALVSAVLFGITYVALVVTFDAIDQQRLYRGVDARLSQRLDEAAQRPEQAGDADLYANAHDLDDAPVFFWRVAASGRPLALTPGAPSLAKAAAARVSPTSVASLGSASFRLRSRQIGGQRIIAGQSLAESDHVEDDLVALELVAGPVLLVAVFLVTLLIGIQAAKPVELARRRQLEFTADASHELRTPLSVIEAEVSLALSDTRGAEEYRDALSRVSHESARLRHIVEDLLWLSRFDSAPPPPGDEPVDVSEIAIACADRFEAVAAGRGIRVSVRREGDIVPWVSAPPEWIDRLTGVLVDNACRYASRNGTIRITVRTPGNRVCLIVEDDGPGIAADAREHLFDRFHRATAEGSGAGLGLAIGDAVVRATGGEWRVGTADLGGARMEVRWHRSAGTRERREPAPLTGHDSARNAKPFVPR